MGLIDFTATTIAGIEEPLFRYWFDGIPQDSVSFPMPQGTAKLIFTPDEFVWTDVNNDEKVIHRGFKVELVMPFTYLTATQMKHIIKAYSWRSYEPNRIRIQCHPHSDFKTFCFDGRFVGNLPFDYTANKYLGHKCEIVFRSTSNIGAIPRITANKIIHRRTY